MKILIYDHNFHLINSRTRYILPIIEVLSRGNEVTLLGDHKFNLDYFKSYYGIQMLNAECQYIEPQYSANELLNRKKHIKKCSLISEFSSVYDVFINNSIDSCFQIVPKSRKSVAISHFPSRLEYTPKSRLDNLLNRIFYEKNFYDSSAISKYGVLVSSSGFASAWIENYWKIQNILSVYTWTEQDMSLVHSEKMKTILAMVKIDSLIEFSETINAFKKVSDTGERGWSMNVVLRTEFRPSQKTIDKIMEFKKSFASYPIKLFINVDRESLDKLYKTAQLFWNMKGMKSPEDSMHTASSLIESIGFQCVPVVSNNSNAEAIIDNGVSGVLVNNIDELVENTITLQKKPEIMKKMSENAFNRSIYFHKGRFLIEIKKLLNIDKNLI